MVNAGKGGGVAAWPGAKITPLVLVVTGGLPPNEQPASSRDSTAMLPTVGMIRRIVGQKIRERIYLSSWIVAVSHLKYPGRHARTVRTIAKVPRLGKPHIRYLLRRLAWCAQDDIPESPTPPILSTFPLSISDGEGVRGWGRSTSP